MASNALESEPPQQADLAGAARRLESLGNTTRLQIFRLLVRSGVTGMAVGDIARQLDIPGSTLSHHLANLVQTNLVTQIREGRVLRCVPNFEQMNQLLAFLTDECCVGLNSCCD